jgi:hypothetical protein
MTATPPEELAREQEAVKRVLAAGEGLSLAKRANHVAKVLGPLCEQELDIELTMHGNARSESDPVPIAGFPGYDVDDEGEATAEVATRPDRPLARETVKCISYGQRLRRIREGIADLEANVAPAVLELAKEKVRNLKPEDES